MQTIIFNTQTKYEKDQCFMENVLLFLRLNPNEA